MIDSFTSRDTYNMSGILIYDPAFEVSIISMTRIVNAKPATAHVVKIPWPIGTIEATSEDEKLLSSLR